MKSKGMKALSLVATAFASGLFLVSLTDAGTNRTPGRLLESPVPSASQADADQSRNKYIVELEKKIAGQDEKPAEEVFANIEIFKGFPAGRVLRIMEMAFGPSLGVDCSHCHVLDRWDSDEKEPKRTARKMWAFVGKVNSELKEAIGKGSVNCTTCHRGQVKPALNLN